MTAMSKNRRRKYVRRLESQNRAMKRAAIQRPVNCNYEIPNRAVVGGQHLPMVFYVFGIMLFVFWLIRAIF